MTTVTDLKKYAQGTEVELPGFVAEEPFFVKLRRPSMLSLASSGKLPNALLGTASELFRKGVADPIKDGDTFKNMADTLLHVAKISLVSPSWEEIEEAGLSLTDAQLLCIYEFLQSGVKSLNRFPKK